MYPTPASAAPRRTTPRASPGHAAGDHRSSIQCPSGRLTPRIHALADLQIQRLRRPHIGPVTVCKSVTRELGGRSLSLLHIRRLITFAPSACTTRRAWYTPPHMAAKKTTLESLAKLISESSASADKKFAALAEDISDIKATVATKDEITRLDGRIDKMDAKIDRIDTKLTKFEDHEIDKRLQLEVRVTTIEKHLGFDNKIAV
jgi:hypothetical protein